VKVLKEAKNISLGQAEYWTASGTVFRKRNIL
jgi:hypothetical protein